MADDSFPRRTLLIIFLGLFLTVRGYRAFEGDQAYRLPVLIGAADPQAFRDDPFVRSFDGFNPHRGSLALIGLAARPFGLSAGLFGLFLLTYAGTAWGIGRLAREAWPDDGEAVGVVAVGLTLMAVAGNIGTNHLFEPIVLDRQMAFALGWVATALTLRGGSAGMAACLGAAALIHPTVGLQLTALLTAGRIAWKVFRLSPGGSWASEFVAVGSSGLAILPGLWVNLRGSSGMLDGLDLATFRLLSVELQGPQHMVPHLWRTSQWLAWGCFPGLAALSYWRGRPCEGANLSAAPARLAILLAINLLALGLAWVGVEQVGHLRLTLFQPFRMATVARGLALVFIAGHVLRLWRRGDRLAKVRAAMLAVGLTGDGSLVVVSAFEAILIAAESPGLPRAGKVGVRAIGFVSLAGGMWFLTRHDTESGHLGLIAAAAGAWVVSYRTLDLDAGRRRRWLAAAWAVPAISAVLLAMPDRLVSDGFKATVARRCRFAEVPVDDVERLALWCRTHTPADARFIGPPGPKGFRLWSHRSVAFNRAGSPYNARGLADWAARFRDHVGFDGSDPEFVKAYQTARHDLERRYDRLDDRGLAALAERQGAGYVLAAGPDARKELSGGASPLTPIRVEGRWAVYRRAGGESPMVLTSAPR